MIIMKTTYGLKTSFNIQPGVQFDKDDGCEKDGPNPINDSITASDTVTSQENIIEDDGAAPDVSLAVSAPTIYF